MERGIPYLLYDNVTWLDGARDWGVKAPDGALADDRFIRDRFYRYCRYLDGIPANLLGNFGNARGGFPFKSGYLLCETLEIKDHAGRDSFAVVGMYFDHPQALVSFLSRCDVEATAASVHRSERLPAFLRPVPRSALPVPPGSIPSAPGRVPGGAPLIQPFRRGESTRLTDAVLLAAGVRGERFPAVLGMSFGRPDPADGDLRFALVFSLRPEDDVPAPSGPGREFAANPPREAAEDGLRNLGLATGTACGAGCEGPPHRWPMPPAVGPDVLRRAAAGKTGRARGVDPGSWLLYLMGFIVVGFAVLSAWFLLHRSMEQEVSPETAYESPGPAPEDRLGRLKALCGEDLRRTRAYRIVSEVPLLPGIGFDERRRRLRRYLETDLPRFRDRLLDFLESNPGPGEYAGHPDPALQKEVREAFDDLEHFFGFEFRGGDGRGDTLVRWREALLDGPLGETPGSERAEDP